MNRLGAILTEHSTTFRIFAKNVFGVRVVVFDKKLDATEYFSMQRRNDGVWETEVCQNLDKKFYYFQILDSESTDWASAKNVIDPYAKAVCRRNNAGVIVSDCNFRTSDGFKTPAVEDLVILEIHLRDILANADCIDSEDDKLTFSGLKKYVKNNKSYIKSIGVNCVELQPIHEFDYTDKKEYQWGYMPNNWFSPSSAYATDPSNASQIAEFRGLVKAFHDDGIAVILDVVYNHFGTNNCLMDIDQNYYFRRDENGNLTNYSGCGNDVKTENPMVAKLIIDSLEHMVTAYHVDGFRFDLAELLGTDLLERVQKRLRSIKNDVILIAEPWSFRANIGVQMKPLDYSVWNDEYREFMMSYVIGNGNAEGMRYFLCGGMDFRSRFPAQSVNYVASHDDLCWIDKITENSNNDGRNPTQNDIRRTHLCAAIMMMSIGVPMIAQGQDFLFSKGGLRNTYNRGDVNALDYRLLKKNSKTHEFFKNLIKFRLSDVGKIMRLSKRPKKTFFRFFPADGGSSACAMVYNDNNELDRQKLVLAINPSNSFNEIDFKNFPIQHTKVVANEEEVFLSYREFYDTVHHSRLVMPPMSCRIFLM